MLSGRFELPWFGPGFDGGGHQLKVPARPGGSRSGISDRRCRFGGHPACVPAGVEGFEPSHHVRDPEALLLARGSPALGPRFRLPRPLDAGLALTLVAGGNGARGHLSRVAAGAHRTRAGRAVVVVRFRSQPGSFFARREAGSPTDLRVRPGHAPQIKNALAGRLRGAPDANSTHRSAAPRKNMAVTPRAA